MVAVRAADRLAKEALLVSGERRFFTEPHYDEFAAILVRLPLIEFEELEAPIVDAWRCQAPVALVEAFEREPRGTAEFVSRGRGP